MTGARRRRRESRDDRSGGYLAELREDLEARGIRLTKRLGQHFLIDPNLNRTIAKAAAGDAGVVLEVGPGAGSLTRPLLELGSRVVAVELDAKLAASLQEHVGGNAGLTVVHADALRSGHVSPELRRAVEEALRQSGRDSFRVVSNLPYSIASTFLIALAGSDMPWVGGGVVIQREVAERLAARPGSREYGAASVAWQLLAHGTVDRIIPRDVFWPKPDVESALFDIAPRHDAPRDVVGRFDEFGAFVKALFSQRRKILRSALRHAGRSVGVDADRLASRVETSGEDVGVDVSSRAESLEPRTILSLWQHVVAL
jgi:16S rRNA (adenine1518-N6/adenine1519-N6)-dimethyltransferase